MTPAEMVAKRKAEGKARKAKSGLGRREVLFDCKISAMLDDLGLTFGDMAKALGCSETGSGRHIHKGFGVTLITAMKIARFFGKPVEEIWSLKEEKKGK